MKESIYNIKDIDYEIRSYILGDKEMEYNLELNKKDYELWNKCDRDIQKLNGSQKLAVKAILKNKLVLIRGPPGTGKSRMSSIALKILKEKMRTMTSKPSSKILVCADSNKAVDRIATIMLKDNLKLVRIVGRNYFKSGMFYDAEKILKDAIIDPSNMKMMAESQREKFDHYKNKIINSDFIACTLSKSGLLADQLNN